MKVDRRQFVAGVGMAAMATTANALPTHHNVVIRTKPATLVTRFPGGGRFTIAMKPSFRITKSETSDVIVCHGDLTIKTDEVVSHEGKRQIRVEILDWVASGTSQALSGPFDFRFVANSRVEAAESRIVAGDVSDFPAVAHFAVPYELRTSLGTARGVKLMSGVIRSLPPAPADVLSISDVAPLVWDSGSAHEQQAVRVDTLFSVCA